MAIGLNLRSFLMTLLLSHVVTDPKSMKSSFLKEHQGYALSSRDFYSCVGSELECGLRCLRDERCRSYNCLMTNHHNNRQSCRLNWETRSSKPGNYEKNNNWAYYELLQVANPQFVCQIGDIWNSRDSLCTCRPGYKGVKCETEKLGYFSSNPGDSCKHIRDAEDSSADGEYWIDPEKNGNPLKVFCDMTTDGGGWLLIANLIYQNASVYSSDDSFIEDSYRGISNYHNNRMGVSKSALNQLRGYMNFTQLRFHCSKQGGRTFHVITVANKTGEAVVQYFSDQTDVLPASCGSFQKMSDDDSRLSVSCSQWGKDEGLYFVGKWGHYNKQGKYRLYHSAAFVKLSYFWNAKNGTWWCDDGKGKVFDHGSMDFWKIYVR
ncbi:uncharacterized protein LOC122946948 isoform X1 [Acropora millepora]|uniref:uncharacterized protein LOC122946948 isoform X1 n=2 Tax=Acropora millepora TaxID=45264 RepID=UPI001CF4C414|nr:uncharacterized protein LOC122946948 isoform X1 [Acropora millepora]